jgi:hypothetical protein
MVGRGHGAHDRRGRFIALDEDVHLPSDVHGHGGTFKFISDGAISKFHDFLLLLAAALACFRPATENAVM